MTRYLDYFAPVLANPDMKHEWEAKTWKAARRLAYNLRQAMHAAQFHEDLTHIHALKQSHMVRHDDKVIAIEPRYSEESFVRTSALPPGAEYGNTLKTMVKFEEVTDVLSLILTLRTIPEDAPWREITFPNARWEDYKPEHRETIWEMAQELNYDVMFVDRLSLVRLDEDSMLLDLRYDPKEEE